MTASSIVPTDSAPPVRRVEARLARLREANESLIISTLGAQDRQASAEAETHSQTRFLSMLAHELRNPLQPIMHATVLLGRMVDGNPDQSRLQAIIARQVGYMARMIDDLLDASRIANGKISLEKSMLPLSEIVGVALEMIEPQLTQRHQTVRVALPPEAVTLYADRVRLAQIFSNLLNNASKFSHDGEVIELQAQVLDGVAQITVRDHGVGIGAELAPFVFDLFRQGSQSLERAHGGLGIGLTLVRALVELHDGAVTLHSDGVGLGTVVTVRLPLAAGNTAPRPPPQQQQPTAAAAPARRLRILLAEDNADANDSLCLLLRDNGHTVLQEFDGDGAVRAALAGALDLLLCDIGLPAKDGYTVVTQIKAALGEGAPVCIALSGYGQTPDRVHATLSGFDDYLVKPVDFDILLDLIQKHVH